MCAKEALLIEANFVYNNESKVIVGFYLPRKCTNVCLGSGEIFSHNYGCNLRNSRRCKKEKEKGSSCSSKIPPNNNCKRGRKRIDLMQERGMIPGSARFEPLPPVAQAILRSGTEWLNSLFLKKREEKKTLYVRQTGADRI